MATDWLCDDSKDIDEERDVGILMRTYTLMRRMGISIESRART